MSVLSTGIYTVSSAEEAEQFVAMAPGMSAAYAEQPGFEKLIVARDVLDPLTIGAVLWRGLQEAAEARTKSQGYREAKSESGGQGLKAKMEFGRLESTKQLESSPDSCRRNHVVSSPRAWDLTSRLCRVRP
jgi:hypothetical protein